MDVKQYIKELEEAAKNNSLSSEFLYNIDKEDERWVISVGTVLEIDTTSEMAGVDDYIDYIAYDISNDLVPLLIAKAYKVSIANVLSKIPTSTMKMVEDTVLELKTERFQELHAKINGESNSARVYLNIAIIVRGPKHQHFDSFYCAQNNKIMMNTDHDFKLRYFLSIKDTDDVVYDATNYLNKQKQQTK